MQFRTAALAAVSLIAASAHAQTLLNGDFSSSTGTDYQNWAPTNWTVLASAADANAKREWVINGRNWVGYNNTGGITFANAVAVSCDTACNGSLHNGVSQTITGLNVGHTYAITFFTGGVHYNGDASSWTPEKMSWDVSFGGEVKHGNSITTQSQAGQYGQTYYQPWVATTLSFVATSGSEMLSFLSQFQPQGAPTWSTLLLAGVSVSDVTPVPEPATAAFMLAGLAGLVAARRRRKN